MKTITKRLEKMPFTKTFVTHFEEDGQKKRIVANIRFDDECCNGHNSFSITGGVYEENRHEPEMAGCIHKEIEKHFPELKKFIKWHLVSSDGPMHYVANTMYHSEEQKAGIPNSWDEKIKFGLFPIAFSIDSKFLKFLQEDKSGFDFEIIEIHHNKRGVEGEYQFGSKYTFGSYGESWAYCPFDNEIEAEEWLKALQKYGFKVVKITNGWTEEKKADLKSARSCAIWPTATKKQLQSKTELTKRLPKLMEAFEKDMIKLKGMK